MKHEFMHLCRFSVLDIFLFPVSLVRILHTLQQLVHDLVQFATFSCIGRQQRQRHITLVERLKSHTATSEALVMSQAKLA